MDHHRKKGESEVAGFTIFEPVQKDSLPLFSGGPATEFEQNSDVLKMPKYFKLGEGRLICSQVEVPYRFWEIRSWDIVTI